MNSILFLGYSNLLKGRILPIISRLLIDNISIAKYGNQDWDEVYTNFEYSVVTYDSYEEGLAQFNGNIVYVSTVNSTHYQYAKEALNKGYHVIVDKPAAVKLDEVLELVELAKSRKLHISESTVYLYHPQFNLIGNIFNENKDTPKLLTVHFTLPPFDSLNFRYQKDLGGGAILDTSSYAASIGRHFFKELPIDVFCIINEKHEDLDIEFSLMMKYSSGRTLIGHFGFNTEYINQIVILGNRTNLIVNRVFTIPEDLENTIAVDHFNQHMVRTSEKGNVFELFFIEVLNAINSGDYAKFYEEMIYDAKVRQMIIDSNINKIV